MIKKNLMKTIPVTQKIGITQLDVSGLQNGIYLLTFENANSRDAVKFTVSH